MGEDRCLISGTKVIRAKSFDDDIFFIFWFYLTKLCHPSIGIYKIEVEKLSSGINKRDQKNKDRIKREIPVVEDLEVAEDLAIIEDRGKNDVEKSGRSNLVVVEELVVENSVVKNPVVEDLGKVNIENGGGKDIEKDNRPDTVAKDPIVKNLILEDLGRANL